MLQGDRPWGSTNRTGYSSTRHRLWVMFQLFRCCFKCDGQHTSAQSKFGLIRQITPHERRHLNLLRLFRSSDLTFNLASRTGITCSHAADTIRKSLSSVSTSEVP